MSMDLQVLHDDLHKKIDEIDETLDSQLDQKAAGKRSIVNGLINDTEETWAPVGTQLVNQLSSAPIEVQIGIYYGLIRKLNAEFQKPLAEAVETMAAAVPEVEVEKLSDEEIASLSKVRSELYAKVKQLVDMNETFGGDADMHMPKRRTGGRGKRGPRAISAFNWTIDDKSYDKLKEVAEEYDQYEKQSDLTKAMREAGLNLKEPGDRIEFTLPDGKILVGVKDPDKVPTEDDSEEEDPELDSEVSEEVSE